MRRVVIFADTKWSIGSVHQNIARELKDKYEFIFHYDAAFYPDKFINDLKSADACISTPNLYVGLTSILKNNLDLFKKFIFVYHYMHDASKWYAMSPYKDLIHFGTTTDILLPVIPKFAHSCPNGVNPSHFTHIIRPGTINTLGWCGNLSWKSKRVDWSYEIANAVHLPVSITCSIPFEKMNSWYQSIDLLLITAGPENHSETGPLPVYEAILCGVPVIGTNVGNFSYIPGPKFSTIKEATKIIQDLMANPGKVQAIAKEQYECVMSTWTYPVVAKKWDKMLESVILQSSPQDSVDI